LHLDQAYAKLRIVHDVSNQYYSMKLRSLTVLLALCQLASAQQLPPDIREGRSRIARSGGKRSVAVEVG